MTTLYRFYDHTNVLLYIGIAGNPARRFEQHAKDKPWWDNVAHVTTTHYPTRDEAATAERLAIIKESPLHNIIHNARTSKATDGIDWVCEHCGGFIDDGRGYLDLDRHDRWHVTHAHCDPTPDSSRYWIAVERIRTTAEFDDWQAHLERKRWFSLDDWKRVAA